MNKMTLERRYRELTEAAVAVARKGEEDDVRRVMSEYYCGDGQAWYPTKVALSSHTRMLIPELNVFMLAAQSLVEQLQLVEEPKQPPESSKIKEAMDCLDDARDALSRLV